MHTYIHTYIQERRIGVANETSPIRVGVYPQDISLIETGKASMKAGMYNVQDGPQHGTKYIEHQVCYEAFVRVCIYIYVCVSVCVSSCMHVCMYAGDYMYNVQDGPQHGTKYIEHQVRYEAFVRVCICVCVCVSSCMHVCMYVCMQATTCTMSRMGRMALNI
jgi:hypothetical protein